MDAFLIARYQSLVNLFQRKPIWWIEQCAYVLFLGACGRFFFRTQDDGLSGWAVLLLILDLLISGYCWLAGRSEVFMEHVFGYHQRLVRSFFTVCFVFYVAIDLLIIFVGGTPKPIGVITDLCQLALTSCFYFGSCEDPPPPKPRTKMSFNGGNA